MRVYKVFERGELFDGILDTGTMVFRQPSPVDEFLFEELEQPDGSKLYSYKSDVGLFLDQQRLSKMNPTVVQQLLGAVRPVVNSGVSDDVLIDSIKSRYIQSNCDMYNYVQAVQHDLNNEVDSIRAVAEERARQASAKSAPVSDESQASE